MPVRHPAAIQAEGLFGSLAVQRYKKMSVPQKHRQDYYGLRTKLQAQRTRLQVQTDKITSPNGQNIKAIHGNSTCQYRHCCRALMASRR
jgi:hypothetical protein